MRMDFNDNWIFYREGDDPLEVTLPHDAMISEKRDAGCPNGVNSGIFPEGNIAMRKNLFCLRRRRPNRLCFTSRGYIRIALWS